MKDRNCKYDSGQCCFSYLKALLFQISYRKKEFLRASAEPERKLKRVPGCLKEAEEDTGLRHWKRSNVCEQQDVNVH